MKGYPKIFHIGTKYIPTLFNGPVEVTEKIDGSQFGFGKKDGELFIRSKKARLYSEAPMEMFREGIEYIASIEDRIPDGMFFHAEYLQKPKHNVLKYDRIPKNHIMLFSVSNNDEEFDPDLEKWAELFEVEAVPVLFNGEISSVAEIEAFLDRESALGGPKIEGVVAKNYNEMAVIGGVPIPIVAGKYVSEAFKEVHRRDWKTSFDSKSKRDIFFESFKTESRWRKGVQHLKEEGKLTESPKDIGPLMKEIGTDISAEEKENIKDWLWNHYKKDIIRTALRGFPEWYKKDLLKGAFDDDKKEEVPNEG